MTNYKEILDKDGYIAQFPTGFSMFPMLRQGIDTVVIKRIDRKPRENDVVFYLLDNCKYILHRVIKVQEKGYIIRGDNCYFNEYNVLDRHIIGILEGFYRGDDYIDCKTNKKYKLIFSYYFSPLFNTKGKQSIISVVTGPRTPIFSATKSPAVPCKQTAATTAFSGSVPLAKNAAIIPPNISPLPAVAIAALPVVLIYIFPDGQAITVYEPFSTVITS